MKPGSFLRQCFGTNILTYIYMHTYIWTYIYGDPRECSVANIRQVSDRACFIWRLRSTQTADKSASTETLRLDSVYPATPRFACHKISHEPRRSFERSVTISRCFHQPSLSSHRNFVSAFRTTFLTRKASSVSTRETFLPYRRIGNKNVVQENCGSKFLFPFGGTGNVCFYRNRCLYDLKLKHTLN